MKLGLSDGLVGCYLNNYTDDGVLLVLPGGETVRDHGSGALQVGSEKVIYLGFLERLERCVLRPRRPGPEKCHYGPKVGSGPKAGGSLFLCTFMYLTGT